jgi:hypothetical protein
MSGHLDVTVPIIMASLLLGWTWLAERWQRYHGRPLTPHTHTDRAIKRSPHAQERAEAQRRPAAPR